MQVTRLQLFQDGGPCRLKTGNIDLLCRLMDWSRYDKGLCHETVQTLLVHHTPKFCSYMSYSRISFFFYLGLLSQIS